MKFNLILKGNTEFYSNLNNKTYNILKVDNSEKEEYMVQFFNQFIENQMKNINMKHYMGIDFEFNKVTKTSRDVALMQINLENESDIGYIFVLYPPELSSKNNKILLNLLTNKYIIKILHGAESLDIPYLFEQLLITKENINKFCVNFYDTKYICDYYHIVNKTKNGKCSIYNLLVDNKIITPQKNDELEKIGKKMGPIYNIVIDIHNLNNYVLQYSIYDVLYLPDLIKKFINKNIVYSKILSEISVIVNKYRRKVDSNFMNMENIVNSMNNYFIKDKGNKIILNEIWLIYYYFLSDKNKYLDDLKEIQYFKYFFEIITKYIVYSNIGPIYKNDKEVINIKFNYDWLSYYPNLYNLFEEYNKELKNDLLKLK